MLVNKLHCRASAVLAIAVVLLVLQQKTQAQVSSSYGNDFYIGFMSNFAATSLTSLRIVIGTTAENVPFVVEGSDRRIHSGTVSFGTPVVVDIPSDPNDLELQVTNSDFANRNKGVHIYSTNNETIFVLAENFIFPFNHGVFLAYPCITIETAISYEYYIISEQATNVVSSQFLLVGCENDTTITVKPKEAIRLPRDLQIESSEFVDVEPETTSDKLLLNKMQTLFVSSAKDLTGTKIVSNKPLTVISGHECANVPFSATGCEPLAFQVPPSATWGTEFLVSPLAGRTVGEEVITIKMISAERTNISYSCGSESKGTRNNVTKFDISLKSNQYCYFESSKPLLFVQLANGGSIDQRGDPTISLISPIDQYINEISFSSLQTSFFPSNYISVTVAAEHYDPGKVLLDGVAIDCEWKAIENGSEVIVGYGCSKEVSSSSAPTQHTVSHMDADGLISVLVYGFNAIPGRGYAYLAGQAIMVTHDGGEVIVVEPDPDTLDFVDLTKFSGTKELDKSIPDATSGPLYIPDGLLFGDKLVTSAYVSENGVISFDKPWKYAFPERFPTNYFWTRQGMVIAPFWSDNDIRKLGAVRYATYCTGNQECDNLKSTEGDALLEEVTEYIQRSEEVPSFRGTWLLVVHWDHVPPSPHGDDDHNGIDEDELNKFNNYQAIVVSNSTRTYAVFLFKCGEIEWSAVGRNGAAVVGFNAAAKSYFNHPYSGRPEVGDAVSCIINSGKRRKRNAHGDDPNVVPIPANDAEKIAIEACAISYKSNKVLIDGTLLSVSALGDKLIPCPCHKQHAEHDGQFRQQDLDDLPESYVCYISTNYVLVTGVLENVALTQQCCYRNDATGALQSSPTDGFAGTMLLYHPYTHNIQYMEADKNFRDRCCNIGFAYHCKKFFRQRTISDCKTPNYVAPAAARGYGEPHFISFDGIGYSFQAEGDYIVLEALQTNKNGEDRPVFTLQGRFNEFPECCPGTVIHELLAFGQSDPDCYLAFQFGRMPAKIWQTKPDDLRGEITNDLRNSQSTWMDSTGSVELSLSGNTLTAIFYKSGIKLEATVGKSYRGEYIEYWVYVPHSFFEKTQGILGQFGKGEVIFKRGDTTPHTIPSNHLVRDSAIYDHLDTWKVRNGESLFFDDVRKKRQTTSEDDFVPVFFSDLNFTDAQRMICGDSLPCLFDVAVTEDMELGMNTLNSEAETFSTQDLLNNSPPNITAEAIFRVTVSEESVFTLFVVDPGDNFTLIIEGGLPDNSVLEAITNEKYVFRWNLQQATTKPLVFIANDTRGAAAVFVPTVEVCACSNEGNCTLDGVLTNNATVVMHCLCTEAFSGQFCEEDRNGCSDIECFEGLECMDIPAPGVGAVCEGCPPGYTGDALKCYDINECSLNETLCQQICVNTDGGYTCSCMEGYQLIEGTSECEDINECAEVNDCQQICENTIGSYDCACMGGFTVANNGKDCDANEPCGGECSFGCAVIDGEEQCFCQIGFVLSTPGGTQCVDQDECLTNPCEHLCTNTEGSFECTCRTGYELQEDGKTCKDVDECFMATIDGLNLCDVNLQCVNNEGSFECICVPGYILVNDTCELIVDEPPPPPPPVVILDVSAENSVNFTSPILSPETFTPELKQAFRKVAATIVTNHCLMVLCNLVLTDGKTQGVSDLKIAPQNIAIPASLITKDNEGQLLFTIYVQLTDGVLAKKDLDSALMEADEQLFRDAGFLEPLPTTMMTTTDSPTTTEVPTTTEMPTTTEAPSPTTTEENPRNCPPLCTVEYCSSSETRRSVCTIPDPQGTECEAECRVTYCHTCYYADEYRPLPGDCATCPFYPSLDQLTNRCFRKWANCVRRNNGSLYKKARGKAEKTPERFKCYEHPCV